YFRSPPPPPASAWPAAPMSTSSVWTGCTPAARSGSSSTACSPTRWSATCTSVRTCCAGRPGSSGEATCTTRPPAQPMTRSGAVVLASLGREVYTARCGDAPRFFDVAYPHELDEAMIDPRLAARKPGQVHIQINNSADETTLEMLDTLGRFRNEDIKVSTVLS